MHLDHAFELLGETPGNVAVLGAATLLAYYAGRGMRRLRLPSIIGYMLVGIVAGPSLLDLFPGESLHRLGLVTNLSLGFIAVSIGSELRLRSLARLGSGIVGIILGQALFAFVAVLLGVLLLTGGDWVMALLLAAMAPATAPAGTVAVIQEFKAKGNLTQALYAVVGFDDGLAIVIYAVVVGVAKAIIFNAAGRSDAGWLSSVLPAFGELGGSLVLGGVLGLLFGFLGRRQRGTSETLILVVAFSMIATGLSWMLHLSLILTNMAIGFVLVNTRTEQAVKRATEPLRTIMPLIFVMFFCLAGAHLVLGELGQIGILGVVYVACRTIGKVVGSSAGAALGPVPDAVRKWTGFGVLAQAGVAIGLSLLVQDELARLAVELKDESLAEMGTRVVVAITASCFFFEIVGPICTKFALQRAGEISETAS